MALPQLSAEQRAIALQKGLEARQARARAKADLRFSIRPMSSVVEQGKTEPAIGKMRVQALLEALPGIGKVKALEIMDDCGISKNRRIGGLGTHQIDALTSHPSTQFRSA